MSNSKDPQSYLLAAGGLSIIAAGITYCAVNWDNPPDWWPNNLQPWWNKKEPEQKQTDKYLKTEDEVEVIEPLVENTPVAPVAPVAQHKEVTEDLVSEGIELKDVTEHLVKPDNVEVTLTEK